MRYGYDMNNPIERQMYIDKHKRDLQRQFDNTKTPQEKYNEIIKEQQKEFEYFRNREKMEIELEKELEKQAAEKLPDILEKQLAELLKGFEMFK